MLTLRRRQPWHHILRLCYRSCHEGGGMSKPPERCNPLSIQMICSKLHCQLFPGQCGEDTMDPADLKGVEQHLQHHDLWGKVTSHQPDTDLILPGLHGNNIDEHFRHLATEQTAEYRHLAETVASAGIPPRPAEWRFAAGWTKYGRDGSVESVPFPTDTELVFDVEVLMTEGPFPTLAAAVSPQHWYSWCSETLIKDKFRWSKQPQLSDLIPLETKPGAVQVPQSAPPRLVIGHNVGFDRSFVKEQYNIQGSPLRFLDTMSMHIAVCGLTNFQRILYQASKGQTKRKEVTEYVEKQQKLGYDGLEDWKAVSAMNNLADVYALHCGGQRLEKAAREVFIDGTMADVRENFQELMTYCSKDVDATLSVFQKLWPEFVERFPHPVTLAGMLEMGTAYLPINRNWERYLQRADSTFEELQRELKLQLMTLADQACHLLHDKQYENDPWLWDLDWTVKAVRVKKAAAKKKSKESDTAEGQTGQEEEDLQTALQDTLLAADNLPKNFPHKAGYPQWYRALCPKPSEEDWTPGPSLISTQMRVAPKLLRMTWEGFPLHFDTKHGWGYLVPGRHDPPTLALLQEQEEEQQVEGELGDRFPLSALEEFVAKSRADFASSPQATDSNWEHVNGRTFDSRAMEPEERWKHLHAVGKKSDPRVFLPDDELLDVGIRGCWFVKLPHKDGKGKRVGNPLAKDFLPRIEDGTLKAGSDSQRILRLCKIMKMCSYWKNNQDRIRGQMAVWLKKSELPRDITKHPDYEEDGMYGAIVPRIVTAGTITRRAVEPTWLTASNVYADRVGSELKGMVQTPPGYHFVGADVDSQELWIAAIMGDSYFKKLHGCTALGWMTLQGQKKAGTDVHSKTASTVGISRDHAKVLNYGRIYGAGLRFAERLLQQFNPSMPAAEARAKAGKMYQATKGKRSKGLWTGGTESHMFNQLERIAHSDLPSTPVLGARISKTLEPDNVGDEFMTSRVNWVVQSSAVDYLHLMLVSMRWLMESYGIKGRFAVSIHDEVRYLVSSPDRYRAALALQITNLLTRCAFAHSLRMYDLPQSIAFFSAVDVDTCLRKEVGQDCVTPSSPHGLSQGYGIPPGEALDIYQVLEKTGGQLGDLLQKRKNGVSRPKSPGTAAADSSADLHSVALAAKSTALNTEGAVENFLDASNAKSLLKESTSKASKQPKKVPSSKPSKKSAKSTSDELSEKTETENISGSKLPAKRQSTKSATSAKKETVVSAAKKTSKASKAKVKPQIEEEPAVELEPPPLEFKDDDFMPTSSVHVFDAPVPKTETTKSKDWIQ